MSLAWDTSLGLRGAKLSCEQLLFLIAKRALPMIFESGSRAQAGCPRIVGV